MVSRVLWRRSSERQTRANSRRRTERDWYATQEKAGLSVRLPAVTSFRQQFLARKHNGRCWDRRLRGHRSRRLWRTTHVLVGTAGIKPDCDDSALSCESRPDGNFGRYTYITGSACRAASATICVRWML